MTDYGEVKYRRNLREDAPPQIRLRPSSTETDVAFKIKRAIELLRSNKEVQVIVKMRGKETSHPDDARQLAEEFLTGVVPEHARLVADPKQIGSKFSCIIAPRLPDEGDGQDNA